jgi:hypothetical protein
MNLRTLFTVGSIAGFIACAFVPPTDANFTSLQDLAKREVRARTAGSLAGGITMNAGQTEQVAKVLKAVASDPELQTAVQKAVGTTADLKSVDEAVTVLKSMASPKTIMKRAATVATAAFRPHKFSAGWKKHKAASEKQRVTQLERIEWASRKNDVRLCGEVEGDTRVTEGDYLALCVAVVTGDPQRCSQIHSLKQLCADELAVF